MNESGFGIVSHLSKELFLLQCMLSIIANIQFKKHSSLSIILNNNQPWLDSLFQLAWAKESSPKVKHFLWRSISNSLPVAQYGHMSHCKRCRLSPMRSRCRNSGSCYVLMPFARLVWALSPIPAPPEGIIGISLFSNLYHALNINKVYPRDEVQSELVPWMLWRLWKSRNELMFKGKEFEAMSILRKAREDVDEWDRRKKVNLSEEGNKRVKIPTNTEHARSWKPSPANSLKCNSDGAWHKERTNSAVGWICRNEEGRVLWMGLRAVTGMESSIRTEVEALLWAVESMARFRYDLIIFEYDSLSLVKMMNGIEEVWPKLLPVIVPTAEVRYYSRGDNMAAHKIVKKTFTFVSNVPKFYYVVPKWLKFQVESD